MVSRTFSPQRLVELRKEAGKSRDELARATGRTWWAVQGWELGHAVPSGQSLAAIAAALGCTIDDLFA